MALQDCFNFGLKNQPVDKEIRCAEYGQKACYFYHPEAISIYANQYYFGLTVDESKPYMAYHFNLGAYPHEIPKKIIPLLDKSSLAKMWKDLETLAVMNYITPFLLFQ